MKKSLFLALIFPSLSIAQPTIDSLDIPSFIFSRNHTRFQIYGGMSPKASFTRSHDKYAIGTSPQVAVGFGFSHYANFGKSLSLVFGLHLAGPVRNFEHYIRANEFSPPLKYDVFVRDNISREIIFLLKLPVTLEKRWFDSKNRFFYINGGISVMYGVLEGVGNHSSVQDINGQSIGYFDMYMQTNNDSKPWLNYLVSVGKGWILKNNHLMTIDAGMNLSCTDFIKGTYEFNVPGQPQVTGDYKFRGSTFGISVGYTLTGANKRWKKLSLN